MGKPVRFAATVVAASLAGLAVAAAGPACAPMVELPPLIECDFDAGGPGTWHQGCPDGYICDLDIGGDACNPDPWIGNPRIENYCWPVTDRDGCCPDGYSANLSEQKFGVNEAHPHACFTFAVCVTPETPEDSCLSYGNFEFARCIKPADGCPTATPPGP